MAEPLITWRGEVLGQWCDYNGHLRDAFYLLIFSYATDGFMEQIGLGESGRQASGHSLFTLECHLNFLHELHQGETVEVQTRVLAFDQKRVQLYHSLHRPGDGQAVAASEQMLLHVDLQGPRSVPFGDASATHLNALHRLHAQLAQPQWVGRVIGLPPPRP
ncbi:MULTISPECIES: thioesterase family protein [unclassified Pseudomonas]|uniref:thioesterase family protein n=1 Tax=unclassified Pseudomonas TaxID=196821 RepID=UPI000BCB0811|nr:MULTISPECIES: thioesterase family protein [unclassified Pseudomonas]PVZ11435.1 acyl-CoA thioester hydrolase [Pseudomonas sp. URIL14HWK12:I12]PVZ22433.1 acyl-CoA thioester hydrolase [Pseudomonas sp. URIL14HWK12:I10]PVZ31443.1 acyl-CoA thioester hydrolase [Pseudomonas sp. URIL14HWK12:I11]SNZ16298.1 acyl-CoA thioester hydrolase [Pseudomonas sp. URIL14HWK12:I9]